MATLSIRWKTSSRYYAFIKNKPIYIYIYSQKVYIYKEIVKNNQINDKYTIEPNTILEAIVQDEGHMTQ